MKDETYIQGKEYSLESTIETMYNKLQDAGIEITKVSTLNPVPYVYSQHIQDASCDLMFTNGKGTSEKSCLASALGEYFERLSCNYFFADYYLGEEISNGEFVHYPNEIWFNVDKESDVMPLGILDENLWNYFDSQKELYPSQIFDLNSGAGERGICTLPFVRQSDKKVIYFPVNFIANIFVSNGMAAGNTKNEAQVQALSEIFERYVKNKIIAEGISLPQIPDAVMNRFPTIKKSIAMLEAHGYHLRLCDASLGGVYPVISVTLINPKNGSVFASFGAHPCFEVALERTVTELLQGRSLDNLDDFHAPTFHTEEVAEHHNLETHFINATGLLSYEFFKETNDYAFVDWDFKGDTQYELAYLCKIVQDEGFEVYVAEYQHLGIYTCRILIPGMSDIYPVDDLAWNNNNEGAYFRESILSLEGLKKEDIKVVLENFEEGQHSDMLKVAEFIGVVPDVNTVWETLQVGELKAMLYLALGEDKNAQTWVTWCIHMANLDEKRSNIYRCLNALLTIRIEGKELEEYRESLVQMYTQECVSVCQDILTQKVRFYGLGSPGLALDGFTKHMSLLEGYKKVQDAMKVYYS